MRGLVWTVLASLSLPAAGAEVDLRSLLSDMWRLDRLARFPEPPYRLVQFSSTDRRSTHPEAPGWFSNSDGFGGEPKPGFLGVLRPPGEDGAGEYLVAEVDGPGAIVRGWSAGMDGVLRVFLDGAERPFFEGKAHDFLARRSEHLLRGAGLDLDPKGVFIQEDADYFPVPFSTSLKVTWTGRLKDLHFYQLQVRCYPEGTRVRPLDPAALRDHAAPIARVIAVLREPEAPETLAGEEEAEAAFDVGPGEAWTWAAPAGPRALVRFRIRLDAGERTRALRGTLLRIAFDGSERPQVESPAGDFFGSGIGLNPFESLPMAVGADGLMTCRFVMPYEMSATVELRNLAGLPVQGRLLVRHAPFRFDDRSLHFRAKWRMDGDLTDPGERRPFDLPWLMIRGTGLLVGAACMVVNPSPVPTAGGNWWGEGDEKILVDDEPVPSTFGTGSEDFFNYSWSRPDLFSHPYCGQPLDTGPDTAGFVSNHRFQILDALPFSRGLFFGMEVWSHDPPPGLGFGRIVYHYARPGSIDDHRRLGGADLAVPRLPRWEPRAAGGAAGAVFHHIEDLAPAVTGGDAATEPLDLVSRGRVWSWRAEPGDRATFRLPVAEEGRRQIVLVAIHRPGGGTFRVRLDGEALPAQKGGDEVSLAIPHGVRALNVRLEPRDLAKGEHEVSLEATAGGVIAFDYLWVRPLQPPRGR